MELTFESLKAKVSKGFYNSRLVLESKHCAFETAAASSFGRLVLRCEPFDEIIKFFSLNEFLVDFDEKFASRFCNMLTLGKEAHFISI